MKSLRSIPCLPVMGLCCLVSCRPADILKVPSPPGVIAASGLNGAASAEAAFAGGRDDFFAAISAPNGLTQWSGLLGDELTWAAFSFYPTEANVDARNTTTMNLGFAESGDAVLQRLLNARSNLLVDEVPLAQYTTGAARAKIGEDYALVGYAELLMAEDYCAGVPLSQAQAAGGVLYGMPLTSDSLLGTAEAHLDSALAYSAGVNDTAAAFDTVAMLARVGLGRVLVDRGQWSAADTVVNSVPTAFVYSTLLAATYNARSPYNTNLYQNTLLTGAFVEFAISDREGTNGMAFVSAQDPRLVFDTARAQTVDGRFRHWPDSIWRYPIKFGEPSTNIPLATGIEARLIQAEAALRSGDTATWLVDLNALRNNGCTGNTNGTCTFGTARVPGQLSGLLSLADPGTVVSRLHLMFSERAFWLFGTGTRLGDLRRLVRQYGPQGQGLASFAADSVYPSGTYAPGNNPTINVLLPAPLTTYGADVALTLPTAASGTTTTNPHYQGCTAPTTQA